MSVGLYLHTTRAPGTLVTARLYNESHKNQLDNDIAESCGAHSDNLTMFRATTDPYPGSVATPVPALGTEIEQLRFVVADIKTVLNGGIPPAQWYSAVAPTAATPVGRGARVVRTVDQAIPFNADTALSYDTVRYDTGVVSPTVDPFFSVGQPTRLTAPVSGLYQLNGSGRWTTGVVSGTFALWIRRNGTALLAESRHNAQTTAVERAFVVGTQVLLTAGDYVEVMAFQTVFGSPFDIIAAEFELELLNPTVSVTPPPEMSMIIIRRTGNFTLSTVNTHVSFGAILGTSDAGTRALVPLNVTFFSMYVQLSTALVGGGTATFKVSVNGVAQAPLTVTIASGGTTGNATGSLPIADGNFVSIEASFAGGTTTAAVRAITIGYSIP